MKEGRYTMEIRPEIREEFPVKEELKDISEEDVLDVAYFAWSKIMKRIRKQRKSIELDQEVVSLSLPVIDNPGRNNSLISLSTIGCMDAHRGECTFCDYGSSKCKKSDIDNNFKRQLDDAFEIIKKENKGYEKLMINLAAIGSIFDNREVPNNIRVEIYRRIAELIKSNPGKKAEWTTESRLCYVTRECLEEMKSVFLEEGIELGKDKDLEVSIGYGIESIDPLVLEGVMGKRIITSSDEDTALLMHEFNINVTVHTLFKPPFLTEKESIDDTVKTVKYAFKKELCDLMIVMTTNLRDATLVGELHEQELYSLASIWSVAEIMQQLGPEISSKCHFFGFSVGDESVEIVKCNDKDEEELMKMILRFSGNNDEFQEIMEFVDSSQSRYKKEWQNRMQYRPENTLQARIATGIDIVSKKYLDMSFTDLMEKIKLKTSNKLKNVEEKNN